MFVSRKSLWWRGPSSGGDGAPRPLAAASAAILAAARCCLTRAARVAAVSEESVSPASRHGHCGGAVAVLRREESDTTRLP